MNDPVADFRKRQKIDALHMAIADLDILRSMIVNIDDDPVDHMPLAIIMQIRRTSELIKDYLATVK